MSPAEKTSSRPCGPWLRTYRAVSPVLCGVAGLARPFSPKLAAGLDGRRGLMDRLAAAAPGLQGCVWFHVTSVGEYEQARPVIAALKREFPALPIAVTHYSPSGREYAAKRPCADFHDYLPLDHPRDMRTLVAAWNPALLVFVKFDCWPNQVLAADRAQVPVILLAGSLQPGSARLKPVGQALYRDVFDRFDHLGVCTAEDGERFTRRMGVRCPVTVTGDTRGEQVILRFEAAAAGETSARLRGLGGRILVLGSTWPPDEKLWLPILPQLLDSHPDLRVVLTPHEPLPQRLAELGSALDLAAIGHLRLSELMAGDDPATARVVLVDSIGHLAEIYRAGHLAYVGGSFTTGVHNTMEPAIAGMPVLFGPVIGNAEEAGRMVDLGVGFVLRTPADALRTAGKLLANPAALSELGAQARQVVLDQRGATEKSMALLRPHLAGLQRSAVNPAP